MLKTRKAYLLPVIIALLVMTSAVAPVAAVGEAIITNKSNIKANVPIDFDCTGLTVSTYYTIYVESALEGNKSTSSTATTLEFTIVVGAELIDTWVTVALKNVTGVNTLASVEIEVVAVIPQYTIDMIGAFIPLLMAFAVVFGLMGGIVVLVMKIIR